MDGNANIFPTTAEAIMRDPKFRAGFADARAGAAFAPDAWGDGPGDIWAYERGWLFARLFPHVRHVGSGRHVDARALQLFGKAMDRGDIL
jgi:hypothetical protein